MKNGLARFEYYLQKIEELMQQASKDKNPALWLYSNDARTPLFMLEGLSRVYVSMHNKKKFGKLKEHIKMLEDAIGNIDYYDSYAKEFLDSPVIPVSIREYMQAQAREKIQHLNEVLQTYKWLGDQPERISKIRKKLHNADWLSPKEEVKAVLDYYKKEIKSINKFVHNTGASFTEMENQVHEFRRDIRWLSIYPQALRGMIQLNDSGPAAEETKKYLIPEIVNSKFNVMPDAGNNHCFLLLDKNHFFALSWMIAQTGKLKDEGLKYYAVAEAIQQTEGLTHEAALAKAFEILNMDKDSIQKILLEASAITSAFIQEGNLDKLIHAVAEIKDEKAA